MLWVLALLTAAQLLILFLVWPDLEIGQRKPRDGLLPVAAERGAASFLDIEGRDAELVWGAWLRVRGFDPGEDILFIEGPPGEPIVLSQCVSAQGHTYLMLSNGTCICLEDLPELPNEAADFIYILFG